MIALTLYIFSILALALTDMRISPAPGGYTGQIITVLISSGRNAGREVQVLDIPHVTLHQGGRVTILLPGLEGVGQIVPAQPARN